MALTVKTPGARIRHIRDELELSQEAFGRHMKVSKAAVSQWENGDIKNLRPANLFAIQNFTGYSAEWIATGAGSSRIKAKHGADNTKVGPNLFSMPLISWVQASQWEDVVDVYRQAEGEKPVYTTRKVGPRAYALRVVGDSMENPNGRPTYPQGSIIIVDPHREALHGSSVIVRLEDSKQATFKQLIVEGGTRYLKPLNPRYPIMKIDKKAAFCGVVVQTVIDED